MVKKVQLGSDPFCKNVMGPNPMQLVVVRAVRKAVSAATIFFATSHRWQLIVS